MTKKTRWFVSGHNPSHVNVEHYERRPDNLGGYEDYLPTQFNTPVLYLNSKQSLVGSKTTYQHSIGDHRKTRESWNTTMLLTANHAGGEKRFRVTVNYSIEGNRSARREYSIFLNQGAATTLSLSPPSGSWAYITNVDIIENAPPTQTGGGGTNGGDTGGGPQPVISIPVIPPGPPSLEIEIPLNP